MIQHGDIVTYSPDGADIVSYRSYRFYERAMRKLGNVLRWRRLANYHERPKPIGRAMGSAREAGDVVRVEIAQ